MVEKGKRKRVETPAEASSSSSLSDFPRSPSPLPVQKRNRHRAETRPCPICNEPIPLRLLAKHADLEASRVDELISNVGSTETWIDPYEFDPNNNFASTSTMSLSSPRSTSTTTTTRLIQRNRKQRHAKLREMTREDDEGYSHTTTRRGRRGHGQDFVCPVCLTTLQGDEDVLDAHVDACVAGEGRRLEEERERRAREEAASRAAAAEQENVQWEDDAGGHVGDVTGTGFHTRDPNAQDVDEEVDIDGDDATIFGNAQFTEGDILSPSSQSASRTREPSQDDTPIDIEGGDDETEEQPEKTLRDLIAEGKATRHQGASSDSPEVVKLKVEEVIGVAESDKLDLAILNARRKGNQTALVTALEDKLNLLESMRVSSSTSLLCRICLDPYNEPTVSTGCWHTCCRECWLRCLGSTKLCPICKRITAAMDLRRVYL
ncbi:hypothetical protein K435DRAFT_814771 [Dendrothele bispora CBS 962.96]|uniref:RING-type domain-containing protein n=1 Tax=Dendrothele bispora (strain CBS 962.96) TaxID=1314807 RepID=A0A4S8MY03_DENBC|nr:hypothetical protein K435DRAFT_814771 [Dendrothele bispora CBS 962.96]